MMIQHLADLCLPGSLVVVKSCMYGGKTGLLIRTIIELERKCVRVLATKHAFDDRYEGQFFLSSHDGLVHKAIPVNSASEILNLTQGQEVDVLVVDEVQFMDTSVVAVFREILKTGVCILTAGLDTDFRRQPFGSMPALYEMAKYKICLKPKCHICSGPAMFTQRLIDGKPANYNDPLILVASLNLYEPRCEKCHVVVGAPA